tara:strand:+ start:435 stop:1589 length:1155 start_codon:yes stop_codon:yes gene_type:complete
MANQQDLVRLLTGISGTQQPVQPAPVAGSKDFAGMFGAQQAAKLSGGIQNLARKGAPSPQQNIASAIGNIDLTSADGLRTMAKVKQIQGDPEGANALNQQAVAMEDKVKEESLARAAAQQEKKRYEIDQARKERELEIKESAEERAVNAAKIRKIYTPKIIYDSKNNTWTAISTDPDSFGDVLTQGSTKTEAQEKAQQVVEQQETARISQKLVVERGVLASQAAAVRDALKVADEKNILPVAYGFALQKANPAYAVAVGGQTYQKVVDALDAIKSAKALGSLMELKKASKTGASGLGATNAMEFRALQDNISKLNPDVPSTIEAGLQAIEKHMDNILRIDQGLEPIIDWADPAYAHMVKEKKNGGLAYSYDGTTWYDVPNQEVQ